MLYIFAASLIPSVNFLIGILELSICLRDILLQGPRPLSQFDLEKVLATSRKTRVAASEYTSLNSQSSGWSRNRDSDDYQVQAAIGELSRLVVSQIMNIQSDTDATRDP